MMAETMLAVMDSDTGKIRIFRLAVSSSEAVKPVSLRLINIWYNPIATEMMMAKRNIT